MLQKYNYVFSTPLIIIRLLAPCERDFGWKFPLDDTLNAANFTECLSLLGQMGRRAAWQAKMSLMRSREPFERIVCRRAQKSGFLRTTKSLTGVVAQIGTNSETTGWMKWTKCEKGNDEQPDGLVWQRSQDLGASGVAHWTGSLDWLWPSSRVTAAQGVIAVEGQVPPSLVSQQPSSCGDVWFISGSC